MSAGRRFPAISVADAHARLTAPGSPFEIEEVEIRGARQRVWKRAPPTLREAFQAGRAFGQRTFLVYNDERASFESFARAALAVSAELQRLGVRKGDRVAIAMRNVPEWPVAFFGAVLVGAIATPLNAWGTGPELEYGLTDSGAKVAFVDRERLERVFEHLPNCPALERVFVSREGEEVAHPLVARLEDLIGETNAWGELPDHPLPAVDLAPDDAFRLQKDYYKRYGSTMRGMMIEHGMEPDAFLDFVHQIDHSPLVPDPLLGSAIEHLPGRKLILTNGTRKHADAVMRRLQIDQHFEDVFDIAAADLEPKPLPQVYHRFLARHGVDPARAAMFEDLARNLEVPHALGMTTVLVVPEGTREVFREDWELAGRDAAYVDHVTDDLAGFLRTIPPPP